MIIHAAPNEIPEAIDFIRDTLKEKKIAGKDVAIITGIILKMCFPGAV